MSGGPPTLGEIPKSSEFNVPTLGSDPVTVNTAGDTTTVNGTPLKESVVNSKVRGHLQQLSPNITDSSDPS